MRRGIPHLLFVAAALVVAASALGAGCAQRGDTVLVKGFPPMLRPPGLVLTRPVYGASPQSPPPVVTIELAKPITPESRMSVWLSGRRVDNRDDSIMLGSDRKMQVSVRTASGEGLYRVDYKVAWRDGGSGVGRFYFRVKRVY